jgi:hypothetical protein
MARDPDSVDAEIDSLKSNHESLERRVRDMESKFDTLETPLWKRAWFRVDGWPGQRNLNAAGRSRRPWHRGR